MEWVCSCKAPVAFCFSVLNVLAWEQGSHEAFLPFDILEDMLGFFDLFMTYKEIAQEQKRCLFLMDERVYDLTLWLSSHPGGRNIIDDNVASGSEAWTRFHAHSPKALRLLRTFFIGYSSYLVPKRC